MMEKDNTIKELKSTIEVNVRVICIDFGVEDPENGAIDKNKRQQDSNFGIQTPTSWSFMKINDHSDAVIKIFCNSITYFSSLL